MDAILLVGGQGTRLRPLTISTPKPMLPVAGVPLTAHQLAQARAGGIDHVVLATSYRAAVFEEYFGDGRRAGLALEYVTESEPLGTGGGIRNVLDRIPAGARDVVVFNGDVLSGLDIAELVAGHERSGAAVTLYLHPVPDVRPFGMVPTDADGRVTAFLEKPATPEEIVTHDVNAGCYVFRREVLESIPTGRPISVEREVFPRLLADGALLRGHVDTGYWLDLGTPEAFVRGSCDLVLGRLASPALPGPVGEFLVLPGAAVAPDAHLSGGTTIGSSAQVGAGARVHASVVLDGAWIGAGAQVADSVVGRDARVGPACVLAGAVLADGVRLGARNELRAGLRVFPGTVLGDAAVRFSSDAGSAG
ncbi:MAG: mannose-1-phosphate guanylyltransferase [Mycobacteriales bacterium]